MGAIARAIEADVLSRTGVNLRGAGGETGKAELEDAGVASSEAASVIEILRACEDARFSPDSVAIEAARESWKRARSVLERLMLPAGGGGAA